MGHIPLDHAGFPPVHSPSDAGPHFNEADAPHDAIQTDLVSGAILGIPLIEYRVSLIATPSRLTCVERVYRTSHKGLKNAFTVFQNASGHGHILPPSVIRYGADCAA